MRLQTVIWKEEDMYVIKEVITGVTTQGKSIEEAINNLKEAIILYLEEVPEALEKIKSTETIGAIYILRKPTDTFCSVELEMILRFPYRLYISDVWIYKFIFSNERV